MSKLVLVVDDEQSVRETLRDILEDNCYRVELASNGQEGLDMIDRLNPDTVLLDIRMPEIDGIRALEIINKRGQHVPVILITAYGSTETTIEGMRLGAFDYLMKPLKINELLDTVKKATEVKAMVQRSGQAEHEVERAKDNIMVGKSPVMQNIYKTIGRVANSTATVLIRGESGTGKELVAEAIHANSVRRAYSFVKINCASIPENLLESELFGHEKGAFTGAVASKQGKFEMAHRGTIFLDEIAEMSLSTQAKLLRVLQDREFERVGGTETIRVDTRIVAATNKNLEKCIEDGTFREDLYYRINVVEIVLPPLRERKEDIPELVCHIIKRCSLEHGKPVSGFDREAMTVLENYDWPGNIRELKNVCERAVLMSSRPLLTVEDLPHSLRKKDRRIEWLGEIQGDSLKEIVAEVEREVILKALAENNWNRTATAQALKINRSSLYAKMKEFGII